MNGSIEWEVSHLVKARLFPHEQSVVRIALRALFEARPDLKRKIVRHDVVTPGKANEVLSRMIEQGYRGPCERLDELI